MLRGGPQASAQDNSKEQQQQKQKKRLSFRDPEVEGPQRDSFYASCRSKTLGRPTKVTNTRKISCSIEDLTLEDQALQIAHDVGSAFSNLSVTDKESTNFLDSKPSDIDRETEIRGSSPSDSESYQVHSPKISVEEDQQYLDAVAPPWEGLTMRGPSVENSDTNSTKNCIPAESSFHEERSPSSTYHQIQLLRYQLEQQNQQTQMALHQIQLLQNQVEAESAARRKAQEQNNQLMQQNKDLLNHMEKLFQQIEDLEKQVQLLLEQEKRSKRTISNPDPPVTSLKQPTSYATNRRPSSDQTMHEKSALHARSQFPAAAKKSSFVPAKIVTTNSKSPTSQNHTTPMSSSRKTSTMSQRSYGIHAKSTDSGTKVKETLRIGDASPPVLQSGTASPFSSGWKLKSPGGTQTSTDKTAGSANRSRAGSFSSFLKKPQESSTTKSTLFSSGSSSLSSTGITNKKYSSSTSDLYNTPSAIQRKSSLVIEDLQTGVKSAVSNLSLSATSKLPRYQPYTGWQRRTSITNDSEPISAVSKDSYKTSSLFNS